MMVVIGGPEPTRVEIRGGEGYSVTLSSMSAVPPTIPVKVAEFGVESDCVSRTESCAVEGATREMERPGAD